MKPNHNVFWNHTVSVPKPPAAFRVLLNISDVRCFDIHWQSTSSVIQVWGCYPSMGQAPKRLCPTLPIMQRYTEGVSRFSEFTIWLKKWNKSALTATSLLDSGFYKPDNCYLHFHILYLKRTRYLTAAVWLYPAAICRFVLDNFK